MILSDKKIIIASYTHIIKGKYTTIGGPGLALRDYLQGRVKKLSCIWQPMPISDTLSVIIETYVNGSFQKVRRLLVPNWPFGRKKTISFIYFITKIRDIVSVYAAKLFLRDRYDIFIGVEALNALAGVGLRRLRLVKKVVYYNLDYGIERFSNPLLNRIFHFLDKAAVSSSDVTWCLSEQMLIERERKGVKNSKENPQLVVPIGKDFKNIKRLPFEGIERKGIVYLGVLEELQGIQLLIDSFSDILKEAPQASFTIIGSGNYEENLKEMVRKRQLADHIKFAGLLPDAEAEEILCKSAVGVALYVDTPDSNTRYTEPTKPKTYLASGLPVIITRVPKIADDIDRAKAGIAIGYKKEELVVSVIKLLNDDNFYKERRERAIAFASDFDWQNIYDKAFNLSVSLN
ncbi:MAG: glycosyltransferase [Candidatus Omnitrophota bacterium]|jgi:glycosyltransferase involved in cell wall biosynthesis